MGSVMCGYNRANQTYLCENRRLMNDVLKEELDFQVGDEFFFSSFLGEGCSLWGSGILVVRLGSC